MNFSHLPCLSCLQQPAALIPNWKSTKLFAGRKDELKEAVRRYCWDEMDCRRHHQSGLSELELSGTKHDCLARGSAGNRRVLGISRRALVRNFVEQGKRRDIFFANQFDITVAVLVRCYDNCFVAAVLQLLLEKGNKF